MSILGTKIFIIAVRNIKNIVKNHQLERRGRITIAGRFY
jgi:hypothetical protein